MLTEQDRKTVLVGWNSTTTSYPSGDRVHELFEEQAARTPDGVAVTAGSLRLTYAGLDARANRLARRLVEQGVGAESVVGVFLERGPELIVSLLAVLKAGGAYLPLDPGYPAHRLAFMLADTGAPVVLCGADLRDRLPAETPAVIEVEPVRDAPVADPGTPARVPGAARGLAYAMYTSGSTGRPKGVLVEHRSIVRLVRDTNYIRLTATDVVAQQASTSFDAATFEIWGALLNGAALAIAPPRAQSAAELGRFLTEQRVTVLWLTAGLFHEMVDAEVGALRGLRAILTGGDVVSPTHWARARRECPDTVLINGYGPTENTTFTTAHVATGEPTAGTPVPIGPPIANTRVFVLDDALRPVPVGETGELYIAGDGLGRGYLNRAGVTAERFVANPWEDGGRMFRTGDQVRWTAEGMLDFAGRADDQIKVRGFRVELGEIREALTEHPDVANAAVAFRRAAAGGGRLVGYVVPRPGAGLDVTALRAHLTGRLPVHMVPAALVEIDRVPLTHNGKVDRDALPAPRFGRSGAAYVAPRDATERVLAEIWAEVLGEDGAGVNDDFFAAGGDSLLAVRVLSKVLAREGVELPAKALFDNPTIAGLAEAVARRRGERAPDLPITPGPAERRPELSFTQQRFWFLHEFDATSIEYNCPAGFRISGAVDIAALNAACRGLIARHTPLRTTFDAVDGHAFQVVREPAELADPLAVEDLSHLPAGERTAELRRLLTAEVSTPFDLRTGPVFRALLVHCAPDDHVLVVNLHHVAVDGWSMGVLTAELTELYAAAMGDRPADLAQLPVRYSDYARWQRDRAADGAFDEQLGYWRERLAELPPLQLPTDRPRPPVRTTAGAVHRFNVPADVTAGLKELGGRHGATLFMTLAAAAQVLFARYSSQPDVAVGTVVSGRARAEVAPLIGSFINTVVLRSQVDGERAFADFLAGMRATVLDAFANQDVPFERLVDALCPERDPSRTPLVQAMVVLQNADMGELDLAGAQVTKAELPHVASMFDITLEFTETDGGLDGVAEYNTDLFHPATIERLAGHLGMLLAGIAADADRPVRDLPLLTESERRTQLVDWNDTAVSFPDERVVHERFADQARRNPDAVAVRAHDGTLTYRELDERADLLARRLAGLGVGPGVAVPVCVRRGAGFVLAVVAIAKAGGAYVPLDPDNPAERLAFVVGDTAASVVLTQRAIADALSGLDVTVLCVDGEQGAPSAPAPAPERAGADDLAYIVYTSGTSGRPKGVMIEHRSLSNLCSWFGAEYAIGPGDVFAQLVATGFDPVSMEVWGALVAGATVAVPSEETLDDPQELVQWMAATAVTVTIVVTARVDSVFDQLARIPTKLRALMIGGDRLTRRPDPGWGFRVTNLYGPTEATVLATAGEVAPEGSLGAGVAPDALPTIGGPVANTTAYVLDPHGEPLPIGAAGELYLGGVQVARGYVGLPELTASQFVRDRFGADPDGRLYRTGDLVRWSADGEIEFLGRVDNQVKIRGYRVEPAEIENALTAHPAVAAAVVLVRQGKAGRPRLVGYVVPAGAAEPAADTLRAFLRETLPAYMVPDAVVTMPEFPLTTRHKVDLAALPDPAPADDELPYTPPEGAVERELAAIWAAVVGVPRVGRDDNFFSLGGDSILALQVVAKARRAGLRLTSKDLFRHQTIAALGDVVTAAGSETPTERDAEPVSGSVPLTPIQHFYFDRIGGPGVFHQTLAAELDPDVDEAALRLAVDALLRQHDALRMRFTQVDGTWSQQNPPPGQAGAEDVFGTIDLSSVPDEELDAAVTRAGRELGETVRPDAGALCRFLLCTTGNGRPARLVLLAQHLVVDGVSWRILLADLESAYAQAVRGDTIDLGAKSSSFRDWALRLTEHARGHGFDGELPYWTGAGADADPTLPTDRDGENTVASARTVHAGLDPETTEALLRAVPSAYRTEINDVLLAALTPVLAGWTGRDRVVVGMEGHGREELFDDIDLTRTVGWLTSYYPVRLAGGGFEDRGAWLKSVKEQLRAVPGKGLGYGALRYCAPGGTLDAHPDPQVSFNYLGRFDGAGGPDGLVRSLSDIALQEDPAARRPHVLDVVGTVRDGRLDFTWTYSSNLHDETTVTALAAAFTENVRALVRHCTEPAAGGRTPSDFPLAGLDQGEVDRIVGGGASAQAVEDIYPLTPMQTGLLFHSLMGQGKTAYFEQLCVVLDGVHEPDHFARAWQQVADRVPVLRTSFVWEDVPQAVQVQHARAEVEVTRLDWRALDEEGQREAAERFLREDSERGIDLAVAPLMRVAIARLTDTRIRLVWTFHHALLDGWSGMQVLGEVLAAYAGLAEGTPFAGAARRPYRDFVAWLAEQDPAAPEGYWRAALAGFESPTALPYDRPRTGTHDAVSSASASVALSEETSRSLYEVAKRAEVTVNTLVQGVWGLLLSRHSGDSDVCFGSTVAGRPAELDDAEAILGLFINTLPVRLTVDDAAGLGEWLRGLQADQVDARAHEHVSLAQVHGWSELPRGVELFDSILVFENYPFDAEMARQHGMELLGISAHSGTNYPLNAIVYPHERFSMLLHYDPALFDEATIDRFAGHLRVVLTAIADGAATRVGALPILTGDEQRRIVEDWGGSAEAVAPAERVHEVIAAQAARRPDAIALVDGARSLDYAELDRRANQVAHYLRDRGVGREDLVGVALRRGVDSIVSTLGVLKAGAAYVPLDPDYPSERLAVMLEVTRPRLVFSDERVRERLAATGAELVVFAGVAEEIGARPDTDPGVPGDSRDLAYVVHTSGSTGRPKGVLVEHGMLRRAARAVADRYGMTPESRTLQVCSPSFDGGIQDLFTTLTVGATLVLPKGDVLTSSESLATQLRETAASVVSLPAALLNALEVDDLPALRSVGSGGDVLPNEVARRWSRGRQLLNLYGPSECAIIATTFEVEHGRDYRNVPIGPPVPGVRLHVLDDALRIVPQGAAGELYIGGVGVSRGYVGRPGQTAERFVADPFGEPGDRLYRTGDVVRWGAEGLLEFVGRADQQVKVRGFRVEPAEVESALTAHPKVAEVVVMARADGGAKRLVAYLVPAEGEPAPTHTELRAHLGAGLPDYMVPTVFVTLDRFPLSPNGKVDRKALPTPGREHTTARAYRAPGNPTESALCAVWSEVLSVDRVGVTDNFFELGGDSISSLRLISRVRRAFGVEVSPRDLFDAPTVEGLSERLQDLILAMFEADVAVAASAGTETE